VLWTDPAASSSESIGSFRKDDRRICAEVALGGLVQKGDHFGEPETVSERIEIYVDETLLTDQTQAGWAKSLTQKLDNNFNVVASWSGPYIFCWSAELGTGIHLAELRFRLTSGGVRKYRWQFALTKGPPPQPPTPIAVGTPEPLPTMDPLPTPEPLPHAITGLVPAPSTSVSREKFDSKVCVGVDIETLLDGQHLDNQTFAQRFKVFLNGIPLSGLKEVTRKLVGSEETHCWIRVAIAPGTYRAVFRFEREPNSVLEHQWYFTIEED
jgi:hypothetical protein